MKKNYFKPNWRAINLAISNPDERKEVFAQLQTIDKKWKKKVADFFADQMKREINDKISMLIRLPFGTLLYYTGSDQRFIGLGGKKVKNGRKYIYVDFEEAGTWGIQPKHLSTFPMSPEQIAIRKMATKITNKVFSK